MARKRFIARAAAVAQISRFTVTANDAATTYTVAIGDWSYSTVGLTDATATAADLAAAITAATATHAANITAANVAGQVDVTGKADGLPFTLTATATGGTGTVSAVSEPTPSASKYHWNVAENWSDGALPGAGDTVDLLELDTPILWGLDQNAVALAALNCYSSAIGFLGLDPFRFTSAADGTGVVASAREYRNQRLRIGIDRLEIGRGDGGGSPRIAIENTKSGASVNRVIRTASASWRSPLLVVDLKLTHASAVLQVDGGLVGVCASIPGEIGQCSVEIAASSSSTRVHVGEGVTVGAWSQRNGTHRLRAAADVATVDVFDGELLAEGEWSMTALALEAGTVIANNTKSGGDAIGAGTLRGGVLDGSRSRDARTWDQLTLHPGAALRLSDAVTLSAFSFADGPIALAASRP